MKIPHVVSLGLFLFMLWIILSGHYSNLLLILGILSAMFVAAIAERMDVVDRESHPTHLNVVAQVKYWLWLLKEILLANLDVCKQVLKPTLDISPSVVKLSSTQKGDLGRVIYANSITLTPGTVTLEVDSDGLLVHALTQESASVLQEGEMDRKVTALEQTV